MTQAAMLERIANAQAAAGKDSLRNIKDERRRIIEVRCPITSEIIMGEVVIEDRGDKIGRELVRRQRLAVRAFGSYREIAIVFDDGSKHISHVSADALKGGLTQDQLELIYCTDAEQLIYECTRDNVPFRWDLWASRVPLRYEG